MSQDVASIKPSYPLFQDDDYKKLLDDKRARSEEPYNDERIEEVFEWTTTSQYQELNFKRQALTINPAKACQERCCAHWGLKTLCLMYTVRRVVWPIFAPILIAISKNP
jgi:hypothetical protein